MNAIRFVVQISFYNSGGVLFRVIKAGIDSDIWTTWFIAQLMVLEPKHKEQRPEQSINCQLQWPLLNIYFYAFKSSTRSSW